MTKSLLIIFTKNPELGKVKTRLAKDIGNEKALAIYKQLLAHTVKVTKELSVTKQVYYSNALQENDIWDNTIYQKKVQTGEDLGVRMLNAFKHGFDSEFERIVIIGSDNFEITQAIIEEAFEQLSKNDIVFGPAEDGGYYLLGMKKLNPNLFKNKIWSTETVLEDSLKDCEDLKVHLLKTLNDVDTIKDLKNINNQYIK